MLYIEVAGSKIVGTANADYQPVGFIPYAGAAAVGWTWDGTRAMPPVEIPVTPSARVDALYTSTEKRVAAGVDKNARIRYGEWLSDPLSSAERLSKIRDVLAWSDTLWADYTRVAAAIKADPQTLEHLMYPTPPCPWKFSDIQNA